MRFLPYAARLLDGAMKQRQIASQDLADHLGVMPNMVNMMRAGTAAIPIERLAAIAVFVGIAERDLLLASVRSFPEQRSWKAVGIALGIVGMATAME